MNVNHRVFPFHINKIEPIASCNWEFISYKEGDREEVKLLDSKTLDFFVINGLIYRLNYHVVD